MQDRDEDILARRLADKEEEKGFKQDLNEDVLTRKLADMEKDFLGRLQAFEKDYNLIIDNSKNFPNSITQKEMGKWIKEAGHYADEFKALNILKKMELLCMKREIQCRKIWIEKYGEENFVDFNTFIRLYFSQEDRKENRKVIDAYEPTRVKAFLFDSIERGEMGYNKLVNEVGSDRAKELKEEYELKKSLFESMFGEKDEEECDEQPSP